MKRLDDMKVFEMNCSLMKADLRRLEEQYGVELSPEPTQSVDRDDTFHPQFPQSLRDAARAMAAHYEIFYCLENFIRELEAVVDLVPVERADCRGSGPGFG